MRNLVFALSPLVGVSLLAGQPPNMTWWCRTHVDPVLHVRFPSEIGDLRMRARTTYDSGDDEYDILYDSFGEDAHALGSGDRYLEVNVCTHDGKPIPDGLNGKVNDKFWEMYDAVEQWAKDVAKYSKVKMLGMVVEGRLRKSGLKYMWSSYTMESPGRVKSHLYITLMFAWRNRFIGLMYEEPSLKGKIEPCESLPSQFLKIVDVIDDLIAKAEAAAKVDVYAIADPKLALEALRQKWLGVEERVSQYDMPDYTEKFSELDRTQNWFEEDRENRAEDFADAAREGIRLKIEPPIWYYNYACALARMGQKDEAIQALEQAIAAGYDESDHAKEDDDLASLRTDARFKKLMAMSDEIKRNWRLPQKSAAIEAGVIRLDESNIYWGLRDSSYMVDVTGATSNTLIYLNHNAEYRPAPVGDMVTVEYAEELQDRGRTCGAANFNFQDVQARKPIPTILDCAALYEEDRTNDVQSVAARMWGDSDASWNEAWHLYENVLGVYDIGTDYADDRVDRIFGWSPVLLACHSQEESDDLVRICSEAWRALKPEVREKGGIRQLLGVIRRGQKGVKTEQDFMSSSAQRPAIPVENIDEEKVLSIASKLGKPYPEIPFISRSALSFETTAVTDLKSSPYDQSVLSSSPHHVAYVARWAEKTGKIEVVVNRGEGELMWKVLQGDPSKIRFTKKASITKKAPTAGVDVICDVMEIACDYHEAFDVMLPNGKKMKSTRVDIGCFRVEDGVVSCPAIVSIYYMPAEKREYGEDGLLQSIDYTKPQIPGWMPRLCPKANFKDEFHWNKAGKCTGWTRTDSAGKKTEFTHDGFVVMTRDGQGRPLDVRRSLLMEWMQQMSPSALATAEEFSDLLPHLCSLYDDNNAPPQETTLAWRYVYEDESDAFGKPSPKDTVKFTYRPELCSRADLSEESGFRLPLMTQMMLGERTYVKYKSDFVMNGIRDGESLTDMIRSDSRYALKELNLEPPAKLKKMQFCPWRASTNDLWKLDMDDFEEKAASLLYELADGVYRMCLLPTVQGGSVRQSYFVQNMYAEEYAFAKLDRAYRRCTEAEARKILGKCRSEEDWKATIFTERQPISKEDLPKDVTKALALWQITGEIYIGILADYRGAFGMRQYFYVRVGEKSEAASFDYFDELPSRAIGNAVLDAYAGKREALNNFAVLLYSEIANPKNYNESAVVALLDRAARLGCPTATYNLGVLYYNRGEKDKARQYFEKAPLSETRDKAESEHPNG